MSHDLRVERLLDGTPADIYDAFIDPDAMREWYQDNPGWVVDVAACDIRVGGTTIVTFGPGDDRYSETMTYLEVERGRKLVYTERFGMPDGSGHDTVVTVSFEPQDGKTLLTIVQTGFPNAEERDAHQNGWPGFLHRLERTASQRRASA